jgi:hypothetical protein
VALISPNEVQKSDFMLKNYLKIALRNLLRHKAYSAINIFGLALGVACCLLLTLYILDETSYDKHHQRAGDIYRINSKFQSDKGFDQLRTASPPIAMAMQDEIPEVEFAVRVLNPPGVAQSLIRYQDNLLSSLFLSPGMAWTNGWRVSLIKFQSNGLFLHGQVWSR